MLENRSTEDIVRIAAAGGGFELRAGNRSPADLLRIAAAAKMGGAKVVLRGLASRSMDELIDIAAAGAGAVMFGDAPP